MSQITFSNNTYAGEELGGFMAATLLGANAVKRGMFTIRPNVKKREVILDIDDTVVLQSRSSKFVDQATVPVQNETYLDPKIYEFMKEQDYSTLIQSWEARDLKAGSFGDFEGVTALSDFLVDRYLSKIAIANEKLYYLGGANTVEYKAATPYIGLLDKIELSTGAYKINLKAFSQAITGIDVNGICTHTAPAGTFRDGDVVTVLGSVGTSMDLTNGGAGSTIEGQSYFIRVQSQTTFQLYRNYLAAQSRVNATFSGTSSAATVQFINVSNVLSVMGSMFAQIDQADRTEADLKVQIALHIATAYKQAQAEKGVNVLGAFNKDLPLEYLGFTLEPMNNFKANAILVARVSNLFLGVDLLGDESNLSTVYMKPFTNDNVVRLKATMKSDVNFKFANEILWVRASLN